MITNVTNLYLRTGSRASRAASGLPPIALSRKPNSERLSRNQKTSAMPIIQTACIGNFSGSAWLARPRNRSMSPGVAFMPGSWNR